MNTKLGVWIGLFSATVISGCSIGPTILPDRFMGSGDAFPSSEAATPPAEFSEATRSSTFNAAFEDVFRAASVAASNAQLHIESEHKSSGFIVASRAVKMIPRGTDNTQPSEHIYFYAVVVRELGPKRTDVRISAKVQGRCQLSILPGHREYCRKLSSGMWAVSQHGTTEELLRFLTFLRNNLIAAGAI